MSKCSICHSKVFMQQMFVLSGLLLKLGYREFAILAQQSDHIRYVHDFVRLIQMEADKRMDASLLTQLHDADLI